MSEPSLAAVLTIDLDAVRANWRLLGERTRPAPCAAVLKANAYGLGAARVGPALARAGCRQFFVAQLAEGVALRQALRDKTANTSIFVLNGVMESERLSFEAHGLVPCLNDLGQVDRWAQFARRLERKLPAALQVDTGMNRLGLPAAELDRLAGEPERLAGIDLRLVMSHLACADEPDHPLNRRQLDRFRTAAARLPAARASLAASSGIFLGPDFHFDLARPGVALYGANPTPWTANPMTQVVRLQGKILQVRSVDRGETVGYGASHRFIRPRRIATVGVGYADGFLRAASDRGGAVLGGVAAPIVGRVSMDLITLDVSDAPEELARPGVLVDLIGGDGSGRGRSLEDVAADAGTIPYEILTALGQRYERRYLGGIG
ncbi:MAG: alanine racemase [Alphaproteobacteria bacterium]|nr:alanine racemase [Alphaproteobacteria bacterium]